MAWDILLGPAIGLILLYGMASMIKHDVLGLERPLDRVLFALKAMGALPLITFFAWATGIWIPS